MIQVLIKLGLLIWLFRLCYQLVILMLKEFR